MRFDFRYVLQQPFLLLWKHKPLILLNLPGSLAGALFTALFPLMFALPFFVESGPLNRLLDDPWPIFALIFGGSVVLMLSTTPLSIFTSSAVIRGVTKVETGQELGSLRDLLREVIPFFWRVVGLTALQGGVGLLFAALPAVLIVITAGVAVICLGPLMPMTTPLVFVFSLVGILAMHIILVEDVGVLEAIRIGWQDFKKTWLSLVLVFLIVSQLGGMIFGVLFILPSLGVVPFFIALSSSDPQTAVVPMSIGLVAVGLFVPFMVFGLMMFTTFTQTALAIMYLEVRKIVPLPHDVPPSPPS
ncbi:MAG: hypothetical protein HUU38_13365 [Anaerolineales bacterium]|nr:hypothetical protein [Anaerolineales bacterium]